jgi:hypothetical protein
MSEAKKPAHHEHARMVTNLLADLGIYFTYGKGPDGNPIWSLVPFATETEPVPVVLAFYADWLNVFFLNPIEHPPTQEILRQILVFNSNLAYASVGLIEDAGSSLSFCVTAQIPVSSLNAENLQIAIGAVIRGAQESRNIIKIKTPTAS